MLLGCYYRCPVAVEEADENYPRFFVLAQLSAYNELADAARVTMHDLLGSSRYYDGIIEKNTFRSADMVRCKAMTGGDVEGPWGKGTIACAIPSEDMDAPYWYYIALPDGTYRKSCETELRIEYSQMDFSPDMQLSSYEFQHPTWFLNRLKVSRNLHVINNATYGFKTLAGCRAFLMPHQISTVARCFETLPIRYMLSDEVGLGKTVEACSILKIFLSENKRLSALIVVPGALIGQWQNELWYKFNIRADVSSLSAKIVLFPMENLNAVQAVLRIKRDLLIVDETHRLLCQNVWYREVQRLSRSTEHVLLLSATPIQDRKEEYRRLLSLLNPEQYETMTLERFSWLVQKQKRIQRSVNQQIDRLARYEEYKELIQSKLAEIAEGLEDNTLTKLVDKIDISAEDQGLEQTHRALSYLCENYRLERRVVRNRRQSIQEKMAVRKLIEIEYTPLTLDENYNEAGAIQNTLAYLSEHSDGTENYVIRVAIPLLGALFSSPWAFEGTLKELHITDSILLQSASSWKRQAMAEHRLVNTALDEDPELIKGRLMRALDHIEQETGLVSDQPCKIVVFTAYNATLLAFLDLFNARYASKAISAVPFGRHMTRSELEDSVYAFQNDPNCRAIICDETGGEGRNFQNADYVLHLDLPWNANALEQRIGRLDRLGRDANVPVVSIVLYTSGTIESQLFHIWKDGLRIFNQSLSGLEIITGELNDRITEALLEDFSNGLADAFEDILEQADDMRESVEDEQLFDIGATLYRPLSYGIDHILKLYAADEDNLFAKAMLGWGEQAGLTSEPKTRDGLIEFRERRFSMGAARQSLFIPPDWTSYSHSSMMRREGKILGSFDRKTAAMREDILFYAPGDAVYDSIIKNAKGCSRGRCAAIGLSGDFTYDGLIYIFNVEVPLHRLIEKGIRIQTLAQFKMFLPLEQIMISIPLLPEGRSVPKEKVFSTLCSAQIFQVEHLGRRGSGRGMRSNLEKFIMQTPPEKWEPLCRQATNLAFKQAVRQLQERSSLDVAKQEMRRIVNGYRAECMYFERDDSLAERKMNEYKEVYSVLRAAQPVLDAVCFLRVRKK